MGPFLHSTQSAGPAPPSSDPATLAAQNARLQEQVEEHLQQKENTDKLIAMLEFNNEHNKNKVKNMEVSNRLLNEKIYALQQELEAKDKSEVEQQLLVKMKELDVRLTKEKEEIVAEMRKRSSEYEERLDKEREEVHAKYQTEVTALKDQVQGLQEIRKGHEQQIKQIETNNSEMHIKLGSVQESRDKAMSEAKTLTEKLEDLTKSSREAEEKASEVTTQLEGKIKELEQKKEELDAKLKSEEAKCKDLEEKLKDLKEQIEKSTETKEQITKELDSFKQFKETLSTDLSSLKEEKEKLSAELRQVTTQYEESKSNLAKETTACESLKSELESLRQNSRTTEESLREEVKQLTSQVENLKAMEKADSDEKIKLLQTQLKEKEEEVLKKFAEAKHTSEQQFQQQLKSLSAEYDKRLSGIPGQPSSPDNAITEAPLATAPENDEGRAALLREAEALVRQVENIWRGKAKEMLATKEQELKAEMLRLQEEWTKERKELERLTGVAAAAFRTGTDSVELLKSQVQQQRQELQLIKHQHQLEVSELKTLLEVKQRRKKVPESGMRLAGTLEDAAEFEYLKNVLYQFMLGKETQTLAKVLCAVVKFDHQQQQEITAFQQQSSALSSDEIMKQEAV